MKLDRNVASDQRAIEALQSAGWRVATIWECALKGRTKLTGGQPMQPLIDWIRSGEQSLTMRGN